MAPTSSPALPRNVKLLGWTSFINDVASEMIFPLIPQFLTNVLRASAVDLGLIEGTADAIASLLKLWSGGRSDRSGRRKGWVMVGYSVAALVRPLSGLAVASWQLLAIRVTDRIGKGVRTSARDALIADSTPPERRGAAYGFHRSMDHLGAAVGPLLAFLFLVVWPDQLRMLFLLTLLPGLAVMALVIFGLKEQPVQTPPAEAFHFSWKPLDATFRRYLLALALFTLGNSSDAFLLLRAGELGVAPYLLPILWLVFHLAKSYGTMLAGRWIDRLGARPLIFVGWLVYAIVYLLFGLADAAWQIWLLFLTYAVYYSLAEPAEKTLVTMLVGTGRKGLAFGWFHFTIGIMTLPASLLFGFVYQQLGALSAFALGAGLAAVAALVLAGVRPPAISPQSAA